MSELRQGNLIADWKKIRPCLVKALRFDHSGQTPETILSAVNLGLAKYVVCDDYFFILRLNDNHSGGLDLVAWIGYSFSKQNMQERIEFDLLFLAKNLGCSAVLSFATRKGYERKRPAGWEKIYTVWRKKV